MRKLASIQQILSIDLIEGADKIEVATVLGWKVVVKKGEFKVGDKAVYFEIDSLLPETDWSRFLFKPEEHGKDKKYRLKTVKLRKQISQGLLVPISSVNADFVTRDVDSDITDELGIEKYEPEVSANLSGKVKSNFPSFLVSKTDEDRAQSNPSLVRELVGKEAYATVKCDGSSVTFVKHDDEIHVCSRNLSLTETEESLYWKMYHKYIKPIFDAENHIAIQAELVGPGIQKNRMGLADYEIRVFNVFNTFNQMLLGLDAQTRFCEQYNLPHAPVVWRGVFEQTSIEQLLEMARGNYEGTKNPREGLVFRPVIPDTSSKGERLSFKVINNDYLLNGGE